MSDENQKSQTLTSPYFSRKSLTQQRFFNQILHHKTSMVSLPDQEELRNQLNAQKGQNNILQEENKKLNTRLKQQQNDIKIYEDLIQRMENNLNFNILATQGDQPFNRMTRQINFIKKSTNYENKQEIDKLTSKINELAEIIKARNINTLQNQNKELLQQKQVQISRIQQLEEIVQGYQKFQIYKTVVKQLPKLKKDYEEVKNNQEEMSRKKQQIFSDLLVIETSNRLIQQLRPNPLQIIEVTQITKQRSSSYKISNEDQIEAKRDIRSNSILKDNNVAKRNLQLIKSIEDKYVKLKLANQQQKKEMINLEKKLATQMQQKVNENKEFSNNAEMNKKTIESLTIDVQMKNQLIANLKQMIQTQASQMNDYVQQIDKQNQEMQILKEKITQAKQEMLDKNNEIEQLNKVIESKEKNLDVIEKEQIIFILQNELDQKKNEEKEYNQKIQELTQNYNQLIQNYDMSKQKIAQQDKEFKTQQNKLVEMEMDLDILKFYDTKINLNVKSYNTNLSSTFQMQLKDSVGDLYIKAVQHGIHKGSPQDCCLLVPSKNIRYASSEWNKKLQEIFIPNDYNNKTIQVEFSQSR
ncbi:unnamed protein product [Paramecium octaurelia]|uniref:Uncharacterized protein n=1 Tax=Paramecium octaurelia TaxID=43137 RepID=A0A8S1UWD1_PAROT|nr:unnamed protein product [Paramecium octaurelia]